MKKINLRKEKIAKNEEYAKRFKKAKSEEERTSKWLNWCRTQGHPASCQVNSCPGGKGAAVPTA